jgi:CubicO group peptidase (beta-lactamase class C family)
MKKFKSIFTKTAFLALLLNLAIISTSCAQKETVKEVENDKVAKIDELVRTYVKRGKFNGSVLVAENGEVIYKNGFGHANMEWDIPNQPDTKFRLASVSKQFTSMLIMQLVAEGKIDLNVPISTYLPDYPKKNAEIITVHHLLSHTSGIPSYTSFDNYRDIMRNPIGVDKLIQLFADSALEFTPGERFSYSNSGYALLGKIIEKVSGKTYEEMAQEKIFTPLGMTNSGYDNNDPVIKNRAAGYYKRAGAFVNADFIDMSVPYSAGALYSTVEDLFLWDQALYTEKLLPKEYLDLLFKEHIAAWDNFYGYGWEISKMQLGNSNYQIATIGHGGGINGFNTQITRFPESKSSVILLNNTSGAPLYKMIVAIAGILNDKTYDFPQFSVSDSLIKVIEKDGFDAGLLFYKEAKTSNDFYLDEDELNLAGYDFLVNKKTDLALAIFKLNVEEFPNSFNVYDSYGEVLLTVGDTAKAIENYTKSIKLYPKNENGIIVLKNLGIDTDSLFPKVTEEQLKTLIGEYKSSNGTKNRKDKEWIIKIEAIDGQLFGHDDGYTYPIIPVKGNEFVNPDDGATIVFNTVNKNKISFVLFNKHEFVKVK